MKFFSANEKYLGNVANVGRPHAVSPSPSLDSPRPKASKYVRNLVLRLSSRHPTQTHEPNDKYQHQYPISNIACVSICAE